jgi:hypothetical protein
LREIYPIVRYDGPPEKREASFKRMMRLFEANDAANTGRKNRVMSTVFPDGTRIRVQTIDEIGSVDIAHIFTPSYQRKGLIPWQTAMIVPILDLHNDFVSIPEDDMPPEGNASFLFWPSCKFGDKFVYCSEGDDEVPERIAEGSRSGDTGIFYRDLDMIYPKWQTGGVE